MREYKVQWAAFKQGVGVQAKWSDTPGDFDNMAFMTWDELEKIAAWRATLDHTPTLVGEGFIATCDVDGVVAVHTTTASHDFAPNQFLTWLGSKTLAWLLNEQRPARTTENRPYGKLTPAILPREFVANAKRKQTVSSGLLALEVTVK